MLKRTTRLIQRVKKTAILILGRNSSVIFLNHSAPPRPALNIQRPKVHYQPVFLSALSIQARLRDQKALRHESIVPHSLPRADIHQSALLPLHPFRLLLRQPVAAPPLIPSRPRWAIGPIAGHSPPDPPQHPLGCPRRPPILPLRSDLHVQVRPLPRRTPMLRPLRLARRAGGFSAARPPLTRAAGIGPAAGAAQPARGSGRCSRSRRRQTAGTATDSAFGWLAWRHS